MSKAWSEGNDRQGVTDGLPADQLDRLLASVRADTIERLLQSRIIVLDGEVHPKAADSVCSQLLMLSAVDGTRDIELYVRSSGGSVDAGLAISDTMQHIGNDVSTLVVGMAAAVGQLLVSAGAKGKRRALARSRIRVHQEFDGIDAVAADPAVRAEQMIHARRSVLEETARHSGRSVGAISGDADLDRWLNPHEALAYGLIDKVIPLPLVALGGKALD